MSKKPLIMLLVAPESSASVLYGLYDVLFSVGAANPDMVAGCPAHRAYRDMFQHHYPQVSFRSESVFCLAAEGDRIVMAGGVSAWHDLAVYLIARFCGYQHAIETAKIFLISGYSEGQSPYSVITRSMESANGPISDCQAWIADNYATDKPVERMVDHSGLNVRTL